MTNYYEFEFTYSDGSVYSVEFEADFTKEDIGIGPYEFWGARGNDKHIVYTCEHVSISAVVDEDGKDVTDKLPKKVQDALDDACIEYADENAPDVSEDEKEYDNE